MQDLQKKKRWESEKYRVWVKSLPSCISGIEPAGDCHHLKGHGFGGTVKAPDWAAIPLTREEHERFHSSGIRTWEEQYGSQFEHVVRTLGKAIQEGIIGEL
mgnify:CR=1 FL=1